MSGSTVHAGAGAEDRSRLPRHLRGVALPDGADVTALRRRYGTDRAPWGAITAAVLVMVPFVCWVVWAAFQQAGQDLRWETVSFSGATDDSITLRFSVYLPSEQTAVCTVRAMDAHGVEVGRAQVPVDADGPSTTVVYALPVTARASTAFVDSCQLEETPR